MIRLDAVRTAERNVKDWCRQTIPLICVARYLSDRPIDWVFFWIGWKFLRSSATYFLDQEEEDVNPIEIEVDKTKYRSRLKSFTETRTTSTDGVSHTSLTALPSVVLSDVASYLHPRDVLGLDTVLRSGMNLRTMTNGSDSNEIITRRLYDASVGHDIWKSLWYRDYGDALLRWKVAREVFRQSLIQSSSGSTDTFDYEDDNENPATDRLEEKLSEHLDEMTGMTASTTMKDFYFLFGECYIDYVLARKNTMAECYLGLHGHIFEFTDFAEFHPGLIEPILKECGGDATFYFEDIPHSSAARNIARRLCVMVDHSSIDYEDNDNDNDDATSNPGCGLEFVRALDDDSSELKELLRSTNTRPLPSTIRTKNGVAQTPSRWMAHIVPRRRKRRRHPTVERIRTHFQHEQRRHEREIPHLRNRNTRDAHGSRSESKSSLATTTTELLSPFWRKQESTPRLYYDPLRQEWDRWYPDDTAMCLT